MNHNMMNSDNDGYFMGINEFSDMTEAEFKIMLGYNSSLKTSYNYVTLESNGNPVSVDWRKKNAVTPVLN